MATFAALAGYLVSGQTVTAENTAVSLACGPNANCGPGFTREQAEATIDTFDKVIERCKAAASQEKDPLSKLLTDDGCNFAVATEGHIQCGEDDPKAYYWLPPDRIAGGKEALNRLLKHSESGNIFGRRQIVGIDQPIAEEQHLALCAVRVVRGRSGPPQDCTTVAMLAKGRQTLIRVGTLPLRCNAAATFRVTPTIDIKFNINTRKSANEFTEALKNMLEMHLGFTADIDLEKDERAKIYAVGFTATVALRDSPILQRGWRESLDLDIAVRPQDGGIAVRGTLRPMVCRQAMGNHTKYHGPDDAQKAAYAAAIDNHVAEAIKASCRRFVKHDATRISCD
jgi:hypothetical protein